jgi:hypothetical protein
LLPHHFLLFPSKTFISATTSFTATRQLPDFLRWERCSVSFYYVSCWCKGRVSDLLHLMSHGLRRIQVVIKVERSERLLITLWALRFPRLLLTHPWRQSLWQSWRIWL